MHPHEKQTPPGHPGAVIHPPAETWMAYLYGELPRADSAPLAAHLMTCPECQAKTGQWRDAMTALDEWCLAPPHRAASRRPVARWAAAAAVLLLGVGIGLVAARATGAQQTAALRRDLRAETARQWSAERDRLLAETTRALAAQQAADSAALLSLVQDMNATHRADYESLHKELETVAVLTEGSLRHAQQQINTLVSYNEPNPTTIPERP